LSLIASELVTNSIKHAELGQGSPPINLSLMRHSATELCLTVQDHGDLPPDFDIETHAGLGLSIVRQLAAQIGGELQFRRDPISFYVVFPEPGTQRLRQ
jgi:two-component sensor histidine kinase